MSLIEVLQEISGRHHKQIKVLRETGPRSGGTKAQIGDRHLAMAKESCEAIAHDFINVHLDNGIAPTKEEMDGVEKRINDTVRQCQHPVEYTLLPSTSEQFQVIAPPLLYKIRKAFEGFRPKNKIGF